MNLRQVELRPDEINWDGLSKRFVNPGELETICHLVKYVKPKTVLEFGVNTGRTAKAILRECDSIQRYIGIDVLPGYITEKKVQRKELPVIPGEFVLDDPKFDLIVSKNGSHDLVSADLPKCDAIFIDGDHSLNGVSHDTMLARSIINPGGVIIWHDYNKLQNRDGSYRVDVAEFLEGEVNKGHDIKHVKATWVAYQFV